MYLIGEETENGLYKIGSTRGDDVSKRLRQLQTSNPNRLYVRESFSTIKPFKLEKMLHNHFKSKNVNGEWFELDDNDIEEFSETCRKYDGIISALNGNPFFK